MSQNLTLPSGYHIRFTHWRTIANDDGTPCTLGPYRRGQSKWHEKGWGPHPRGGTTMATIYDSEDQEVAIGVSDCSMLDAFRYKIGIAISRGRALKKLAEKLQPSKGSPEPLPRPLEPRLPYLWVGDSKYIKVLD